MSRRNRKSRPRAKALWTERLPKRTHDSRDLIELFRRLVAERRDLWQARYGSEMPYERASHEVYELLMSRVDAEQATTIESFFAESHETPDPAEIDDDAETDDD